MQKLYFVPRENLTNAITAANMLYIGIEFDSVDEVGWLKFRLTNGVGTPSNWADVLHLYGYTRGE